jgi:hypothetical protein
LPLVLRDGSRTGLFFPRGTGDPAAWRVAGFIVQSMAVPFRPGHQEIGNPVAIILRAMQLLLLLLDLFLYSNQDRTAVSRGSSYGMQIGALALFGISTMLLLLALFANAHG